MFDLNRLTGAVPQAPAKPVKVVSGLYIAKAFRSYPKWKRARDAASWVRGEVTVTPTIKLAASVFGTTPPQVKAQLNIASAITTTPATGTAPRHSATAPWSASSPRSKSSASARHRQADPAAVAVAGGGVTKGPEDQGVTRECVAPYPQGNAMSKQSALALANYLATAQWWTALHRRPVC